MSVRVTREDDWPAILEVHRQAFGDDDVPRLAGELHASTDLYVPELSFVAVDGGLTDKERAALTERLATGDLAGYLSRT